MNKKTAPIILLFPNYEETIDYLYQSDSNFQDICSDYDLCINMIQERENDLHKNKAEMSEFLALKREIEDEILKEIFKVKSTI